MERENVYTSGVCGERQSVYDWTEHGGGDWPDE